MNTQEQVPWVRCCSRCFEYIPSFNLLNTEDSIPCQLFKTPLRCYLYFTDRDMEAKRWDVIYLGTHIR